MNKFKVLLLIVSIFLNLKIEAQSENNYFISSAFSKGFILTPYGKVANLKIYTSTYQLDLGIQSSNFNYWDSLYNYPCKKIQFCITDFQNTTILSRAYVINHNFNYVFNLKHKRLFFSMEGGFGAAYFDKIFNLNDNIKNKAIGSKVNVSFFFNTRLNYSIKKWNIYSGFNFIHYSSGALNLPNNGLNIPGLNFGIQYQFYKGKNDSNKRIVNQTQILAERKQYIYALWATKAEGIFGERRFYPLGLSYRYGWKTSKMNISGIGADYYYDASMPYQTFQSYPEGFQLGKKSQLGVRAETEFVYKKTGAIISFGGYLYNPNMYLTGRYYQHLGIRYHINKRFFSGVMVKLHLGRADFIQWIAGYNL